MSHADSLRALVRRFWSYQRAVRAPWLATAAIMAVTPFLGAALLWSVKTLVDEVFVAGRLQLLPMFVAVYVAIVLAKMVLGYAETRLEASVVERIAQDLRVDLYRHLISVSPSSLRERSVGDQLTRLSGDVEKVEFLIFTGPLGVFANLVAAAVFLSALLLLSWKLTLCALLIVPLLAAASWRLAPRVRRASRISRRAVARWTALAEERLGAGPIIHAFTAQAFETDAFRRRCATARLAELRTVSVQAWLGLLVEAAAALGGLLVLIVGAYEIQSGNMTIGTLIAFLGSVGSLYGPMRGLARAYGRFQRSAAGAQRVAELLDTPSLVTDLPTARPLSGRARGELEFSDLRFGYTPPAEILKGVSLKISAGETVALVGASGSGKSSLVKLALRLHDPWSGSVRLDGHDLRDLTLSSVRENIAVVLQDPFVFTGSIRENIGYALPQASEDRVRAAARTAHVEDFAGRLRGEYDAAIGPRGSWLSGGQRQRIAFARALMREAPILLLDEAMASVDSETEQLMMEALERLAGNRTLLIVAHRLSSIRRADRVAVLEDGQVVESGPPLKLLQPGTRCRALFAAQLTHEDHASAA